MMGSKGSKGHMEGKLQVIADLSEEVIKQIKKEEIDKESIEKKVNQILVISTSLIDLGEHIRGEVEKKIENLDSELVKFI